MAAEGGCLCGETRFAIEGAIGKAGYCHCEDCRRVTGSAFNISVPVEIASFRLLSGRLGSFTKFSDSGHELTRYFCQTCGSPIYAAAPKHPSKIYVKAGCLDDATVISPELEAWCRSRVSWSKIPENLQQYELGRS